MAAAICMCFQYAMQRYRHGLWWRSLVFVRSLLSTRLLQSLSSGRWHNVMFIVSWLYFDVSYIACCVSVRCCFNAVFELPRSCEFKEHSNAASWCKLRALPLQDTYCEHCCSVALVAAAILQSVYLGQAYVAQARGATRYPILSLYDIRLGRSVHCGICNIPLISIRVSE